MDLNGEQRSYLHQAIMSAYPTQDKLAIMLDFSLEENLVEISGETDLRTVVFKLIQWAKTEGKLEKLIESAYNKNPGNPELENFYRTVYKEVKILEKLKKARSINQKLEQNLEYEKSKNRQLNTELEKERNINQKLRQKIELHLNQNQQNKSNLYNLIVSLKSLLKDHKWEEANQETLNIISQILHHLYNKNPEESLDKRDIHILPCYLLYQIDLMWQKYSDNCFGLTIQKNIWQENIWQEKEYTNLEKFGYYLGWYDYDMKKWHLLSEPAFRAKVSCNRKKYKGILPTLSSDLEVNAILIPCIIEKLGIIEKLEYCNYDLFSPMEIINNN
ncbi:effector-associated domain EAD1-containing protein [Mastigocoleus sp. MO_188.B34]|uniref:effector-associated domain EAD1-containing protein n=1 Tax=Mastigocoleus sp. MO_188.B34 TaxID=3036635 RepID=UPI0026086B9A|nr:effector-associated domain EAD1-containing protein [Mastigocoleus sp. MO_188.B34]MDJ0694211.1 effector-associated domain EAD1-containing protein [Mastigocoleus sp. MO_188.B34]